MECEKHRKYCNILKKELLRCAIVGLKKIKLLDLCCGRGGDIFKWENLKIGEVYGFDIDKESINEAIRRYKIGRKHRKLRVRISFYTSSSYNGDFIRRMCRYQCSNVVSCMFAIHYFCKSRENLEKFMNVVSINLDLGGTFVGVSPDEKYIRRLMDPTDTYKCDKVFVRSTGEKSYKFFIKDKSKNDYFSFKGVSDEYIVNKLELRKIALKYGLYLVYYKNIYDDYPNLDGDRVPLSQLYFSFMFVKKKKTL